MLNPNDVIPLYKQLEEIIRQKISLGELNPSDRLPSVGILAKEHGVSIITVRKAISSLAEAGLIETRQGKGTYITAPRFGRNLNKMMSFSESCKINGTRAGSKLIECRIIDASPKTLEKLNRPNDKQVVFLSRLRYVNEEPMIIETNQFPIEFAYLINEDVENRSLYELLREKDGLEMGFADRELEICRATQREAKMLQIKKGAPLLLIRAVIYLQNGDPIYVGTQVINGERYRFSMSVLI